MKHHVVLLFGCIFLSSCSPTYTPHNPPRPKGASSEVQQVAALAFVSYAGDALDNTDPRVDEKLQACIAWELRRQPILEERFGLAWGPSVYRFEGVELDDNMMYAVWNDGLPGELVIAIRGTNFASYSDWIAEDFFVTETVAWKYSNPENPNARISKATDIGLTVLQGMKGRNHASGCNGSILLEDFLWENVRNGKLKKITVTGHSLAGALAPVFALWLKDAVFNKPELGDVDINVVPIAGATPGNADFAAYYDSRLGGEKTNRLHNPFDIVPQAWSISSMKKIPSIFTTTEPKHSIHPSFIERGVFSAGIDLARGKHYTHIKANQASTGGIISMEAKDESCKVTFASQAGWQHHCGYYNALGMSKLMVNTNSSCLTAEYCDANRDSKECRHLFENDRCSACQLIPIE